MCVQICHMVNIDVAASVGAPPLKTQLGSYEDATKSSKKVYFQNVQNWSDSLEHIDARFG